MHVSKHYIYRYEELEQEVKFSDAKDKSADAKNAVIVEDDEKLKLSVEEMKNEF